MIDTIAAGLNRGENFLIYPAGRTERRGIEEIGATRAVADLLERCPQANIVLVRTRGVWGSIFTMAYTGEHPNLERCVVRALGWVFAALFVFLPRRNVTMTVEQIDRRDLPGITRDKLNPFLEEWYNRGGAGETDVRALQLSLRPAAARISRADQDRPGRSGQDPAGHDPRGQRDGRRAAEAAAFGRREFRRDAPGTARAR